MLGLHFTPACVLLLVFSPHFTRSLHFTPGPQSAVRSLRFTLTDSLFVVTIFEKYTISPTVEVYLVISLISGASVYLNNSAE